MSESSIVRFGTSIVGKEFEWEYLNDQDEQVVVKARARASMKFDSVLRYQTAKQTQAFHALGVAKHMSDQLRDIDVTDPGAVDLINKIVDERLENDSGAWEAAVDMVLMLVREADHEALRPALIDADPKQLAALREWLEGEVIGIAEQTAAVTTGVDPSSEPSPGESAPSPASGPGSEPEE